MQFGDRVLQMRFSWRTQKFHQRTQRLKALEQMPTLWGAHLQATHDARLWLLDAPQSVGERQAQCTTLPPTYFRNRGCRGLPAT